jgi:hypothetical protein
MSDNSFALSHKLYVTENTHCSVAWCPRPLERLHRFLASGRVAAICELPWRLFGYGPEPIEAGRDHYRFENFADYPTIGVAKANVIVIV